MNFNYRSIITIYNLCMSFEGKVKEKFKDLVTSIFKNAFGAESKRQNYLK